jgi:acetyl esterase/lipase
MVCVVRTLNVLLIGAIASATIGCSTASGTGAAQTSLVADGDWAATAPMTLEFPSGASSATLIVLVPGGGWATADPTGLLPLASALAAEGAAVAAITHRAQADDAFYPVPVHDIACGVARAVAETKSAGFDVDGVVLVGHSSGAHLASLVALAGIEANAGCPYEPVAADSLVGLAGPYDITRMGSLASNLFAPGSPDSDRADANPFTHVGLRPDVDVLLVHGLDDDTVPQFFTDEFAGALTQSGHTVELIHAGGVDHHSIYSAEFAAPLIGNWLNLPGDS